VHGLFAFSSVPRHPCKAPVNAINTLPPNSLWAAAAEAEGILRTTQKEFAHDPERSVTSGSDLCSTEHLFLSCPQLSRTELWVGQVTGIRSQTAAYDGVRATSRRMLPAPKPEANSVCVRGLMQGTLYKDMLFIKDLSGHIPIQQLSNSAFMGGYAIVSNAIMGCWHLASNRSTASLTVRSQEHHLCVHHQGGG
jgi:hypothetical protein